MVRGRGDRDRGIAVTVVERAARARTAKMERRPPRRGARSGNCRGNRNGTARPQCCEALNSVNPPCSRGQNGRAANGRTIVGPTMRGGSRTPGSRCSRSTRPRISTASRAGGPLHVRTWRRTVGRGPCVSTRARRPRSPTSVQVPAGERLNGPVDGVRPADPVGLGLRRSALASARSGDRRRDRHDRRQANRVRRIPLDEVSTSMTIRRRRPPCSWPLRARRRRAGRAPGQHFGDSAERHLKEYIARGTTSTRRSRRCA